MSCITKVFRVIGGDAQVIIACQWLKSKGSRDFLRVLLVYSL